MIIDQNEDKFFKFIRNSLFQALNNNKVILTNFLNVREQVIAKEVLNKENFNSYLFFGGYDEAEYKRLLISPYTLCLSDTLIKIIEIDYNKRYLTLKHRKVLGALMNLGIKREVIGDILIGDKSYIIISSSIFEFLLREFKTISGVPISLKEVPKLTGDFSPNYDEKKVTCQSMRLDLLLSKMYNLNRNESKKLVCAGDIKVNHELSLNPSLVLNENDVISIRHKGRIKIIKIEGKTKKDKFKIILGSLVN